MALGHPTREWSNRDSQLGLWNSSHLGVSVVTKTFRALAEHDFYSLAPALVNANELPLDLGGNVTQQDVGRGMYVQSGRHQVQQRLFDRQFTPRKYPKRGNSPRE